MRLHALLALLLLFPGCGPFRRAKAPPPPPGPIPVRIPDQPTSIEPAPPPKNLPAPPAIATSDGDGEAPTTRAVGLPVPPAVAPPRPVQKKPQTRRAAVPTAPPPSASPPSSESAEESVPTPPFRLGVLRSPEETEQLRRETESLVSVCNSALAAAEGRALTAMQTEMVSRVKTFAQQARDAMDKDPGEARNFAAKGKTFAEALLSELR